ncbi:hypothetical protein J6590_028588 [Homalodisca vitripennis]|nr:hypothetical protein J6590_028588 [Homalodisca vitripennis]
MKSRLERTNQTMSLHRNESTNNTPHALQNSESCDIGFRELGFLTLPSLYIPDVTLYCQLKFELFQGRDVHQYETRGRNNFFLSKAFYFTQLMSL